jgi:hypothetical protein
MDAMTQGRFGNAQRPAGGCKAAAVNDLHKVEEVIQIEHVRLIVQ